MKKSNKYRTVMNCSFRVLSKVFITIVNEIIYNKSNETIKKYKILCISLIEKLKASFSDYINYKKEINSNKIEVKNNCIDYLLNLTFGDFLKSAGFPYKDTSCSIKLPDLMIKIINDILYKSNKYELNIINSLKENNIFLDELKGNNKIKSEKGEPKNEYYEIYNRGDNKLFINFLEQKCSKIINIITSENYKQEINKFLYKKRKFNVIKNSENSNINMKDNVQNPTNDENIDIFKENNYNDENNQHDIYHKKEQTGKIENNLTNCSTTNNEITNKDEQPKQDKMIIEETEDYYIVDGNQILKNYKSKLNEIFQEIFE